MLVRAVRICAVILCSSVAGTTFLGFEFASAGGIEQGTGTAEKVVVTFDFLQSPSDGVVKFSFRVTNNTKSDVCIPDWNNKNFVNLFRATDKAELNFDIGDSFDASSSEPNGQRKLLIEPKQSIRLIAKWTKRPMGYFTLQDGTFAGRQSGSEVIVATANIPVFSCGYSTFEDALSAMKVKYLTSNESTEFTF